jgi:hypothetical protein
VTDLRLSLEEGHTGRSLMLQNPESYEEWEETVWAKHKDAACVLCQAIAAEATLTAVINVTQETKKLSKNGTYRFVCRFRSEVSPNDSSNT